ncbi:uncharacterized protein [Eurosta solidaginis]|uniref:uncharacterized protein n=1 Tax=Eurosta solidaginis TaxID=178769 RepID=UPI00353088D7
MRELILLVCLVVCCHAAPATQQQSSNEPKDQSLILNRPSPINPDIPSDPKPEEKITMITDPKEIVKHKREVVDDPYDHISHFAPTVQPEKQVVKLETQETPKKYSLEADSIHYRQKREEEGHILEAKKPAKAPAVELPLTPEVDTEKTKPRRHHNAPATVLATPIHNLPKTRQRRQVDPHLIGASTVGFPPQIHTEDNEQKAQDEEDKTESPPQEQHVSVKQQKEDDLKVDSAAEHEAGQAKRDIPVPLVPKYHHSEESPKTGEKVEEAQATNAHRIDAQHQSAGCKGDKRSESDERDDDTKENRPVAPIYPHQSVHAAVHPHEGNSYHSQTQPVLLDAPNTESIVHDKPLVEDEHHQLIHPVVHSQHASSNLPRLSSLPLDVERPNSDNSISLAGSEVAHELPSDQHETPVGEVVIKPLVDQLADKETKIIAFAPPANQDHIVIKHPVPVAELFSGPKE